jgi:hypothetical protein
VPAITGRFVSFRDGVAVETDTRPHAAATVA